MYMQHVCVTHMNQSFFNTYHFHVAVSALQSNLDMCERAAPHWPQKQGSPVASTSSLPSSPRCSTKALVLVAFTLIFFSSFFTGGGGAAAASFGCGSDLEDLLNNPPKSPLLLLFARVLGEWSIRIAFGMPLTTTCLRYESSMVGS